MSENINLLVYIFVIFASEAFSILEFTFLAENGQSVVPGNKTFKCSLSLQSVKKKTKEN